jgi:co-chaperonin GroES (HSP10)
LVTSLLPETDVQPYADCLRLLRDEVLIRVIAPERMTAAKRLYIPDSAQREDYELYQGEVIACGPGARRRKDGKTNAMEVKPGDRILFYWVAGECALNKLFSDDGAELRIISESYIQAVLNAG